MISADHQRYRLGIIISSTTMTLAYYRQRLWNVLPKKYVRKFSDEFSKYVLQQDEFSKCIFHLGRVFFRTSFPYTLDSWCYWKWSTWTKKSKARDVIISIGEIFKMQWFRIPFHIISIWVLLSVNVNYTSRGNRFRRFRVDLRITNLLRSVAPSQFLSTPRHVML